VSRTHVPGLDGLRGLAVAGVLVFHANALLRGGYLGVDLFFVLSGFLITRILLDERERDGRVDLKRFWIRRARRLMPALLAMMPAVALYAKLIARPNELVSLRADALATLAYVANWRSIFAHRSYWEMFLAPSPLEHTWSLAIEEQFYLVWPLVVLVLGRRRLLWACIVLALASAIGMALLFDEGNTTRVYLGTDTRGAAILIGAALACLGDVRTGKRLDLAAFFALAVLAAAWLRLDGQSELLYRGGFFVTEIAAAVLIAACVFRPESGVARVFTLRPLRALGTVSYGVYLWHWPIYVVLTEERTHLSPLALLALRVVVTLVIAAASYRFLERPIRERGLSFGRPIVIVPGAFAAAVLVVVLSTRAVVASPLLSAERGPEPQAGLPEAKDAPAKVIDFGMIPPASELPPGTLRVLVLGDSVALALGARMHFAQDSAEAYADHRAIGDCSILDGIAPVFSMSGPPHGNGNCARNWVADVAELKPDVAVVVLGGAYFSTVEVDGRRRSVCHPGWGNAYRKRLRELLDALAPHTKRRAVVLAAYPVGKWQTPTLNGKVDCYNRILKEAAEAANADVIDLNAFVCPDGHCTLMSRDAPVRPDGLHFDGLGAEDTARWVLAQVRQL
jgi:peptidoglycan/LPS O-acetylase OafA/YrhL